MEDFVIGGGGGSLTGFPSESKQNLLFFYNSNSKLRKVISRIAKYQERALLNPHKGIGVACASRRNCIETAPYSIPQCTALLNRDKPHGAVAQYAANRPIQ